MRRLYCTNNVGNTITPYNCTLSGVKDSHASLKFAVHPNPNYSGLLNITIPHNYHLTSIINVNGELMCNYQFNKDSNEPRIILDLSKYESGVYFLLFNSTFGDTKSIPISIIK